MSKLSIAVLLTMLETSALLPTRSEAQVVRGCCPIVVPPACYPVLRVPPEVYAAGAVVYPSPPRAPMSYSAWYYTLYEPNCAGKPAAKCVWGCVPVWPKSLG